MAQKDRRLTLSAKFRALLKSNNVYFQPPESKKMVYPCIRYERAKIPVTKADNLNYLAHTNYTVILITTDPDSDLPYQILDEFKGQISHLQHYVKDNLIHDVYTLTF